MTREDLEGWRELAVGMRERAGATPDEGGWGVSGEMVVTPSPAEEARRIAAQEYGHTSRRIALVASGHYLPVPLAEACCVFIASARQDVPAAADAIDALLAEVEVLWRIMGDKVQDGERERMGFEAGVRAAVAALRAVAALSDERPFGTSSRAYRAGAEVVESLLKGR